MNLLSFIQAKHNLIFKIFMVLVCSLLLALMLPDREVKGYRVDSFSAVWPYEDLIAEEEFYIRKSDNELKREKEKIRRDAPAFYYKSEREKRTKMRDLENLRNTSPHDFHLLKPLFDSIYERGVIESVDGVTDHKSIFISSGNYAEVASLYDFFTIQSAAWFLDNSLRGDKVSANYLDFLAITHYFDRSRTGAFLQGKLKQISVYKSVIPQGQLIVKKGEVLTNSKRYLINRYFFFRNQNSVFSWGSFIAKWGLTFLLCLVLLTFLAFFRRQLFGQNTQVAFLLMLLLIGVAATSFCSRYGLMIMALPYALVPIMVRVFFDGRTALFTFLMLILHCSFFTADKLEFILMQLLPGIGTLFAVAEMRKRQQILNAAAVVFVFYIFVFITYHVGFGTSIAVQKVSAYIPFAISSMLVLLAYPLIYLTERFFGFLSDFKLLELCDLNHPLLRKLSKDVPGTFQHSLQVANLAEEAIFYIGGNSLLVRAGAMYHDIGKMHNPNFFTENQANGFSPHQEIEPLESAKIIIDHVILGVEMAKKYRLPEQIIDFIRTHHGTTSVKYFYDLYVKQQGAGAKTHENQFRYPGPIPFSKETAVLMIADGVEAASRSLKIHDAVTISDLVDNMIQYKIESNQFINADITFKDITVIKKIFKKRLMNIYHARIEYPA